MSDQGELFYNRFLGHGLDDSKKCCQEPEIWIARINASSVSPGTAEH